MHSYARSWSSDEYIGNGADVISTEEESSPVIDGNSMEVIQSHCNHNNYKMDLYNSGTMVICSTNDEEKYWTDSGMHSPDCCGGDISSPDDITLSKQQRLCNTSNIPSNPFCISPSYPIYSNSITSTNYGTHLDETHYTNHLKNHHENNCNTLINSYNNPNIMISTGPSITDDGTKPVAAQCQNTTTSPPQEPFVRVVKKRNTANKKERRRTQSINNAYADLRDCIPSVPADTKLSKINNAYADLRDCIPSVPADTKLSKIKTLRLATSYISYLKAVLDGDKPGNGFCAEIENLGGHRHSSRNNNASCYKEITGDITICTPESVRQLNRKSKPNNHELQKEDMLSLNNNKTSKGRTGWPEHVWALEFKQEQNL